jgi:hypothetical protein
MISAEDAVIEVSRQQREYKPRVSADFNAISIPSDTPAYSRSWLLSLDGAIATEARAHHGGDSDIARLVVGRRCLARADGDSYFFLSQWLRLFEAQAEAREAGKAPPLQSWTVPGIRGIAA